MNRVSKFALISIALGLIVPLSANALVLRPFGGTIVSIVPCTCVAKPNAARLLIKTPRGMINLDYNYFSQKYLSYTLPRATYVVGNYATGVPSCWDTGTTGCNPRVTPPALGTITSVVGSSSR